MNEYIEVQFRKNGRRFKVKRRVPGGVEFDEPDPIERTVGIGFHPRGDPTIERVNSIRRIQGWEPGLFKLKPSVEDGSLILRGEHSHTLPEGLYEIQLQIEEAKAVGGWRRFEIKHDGHAVVPIDLKMDDRQLKVDLTSCDEKIHAILNRSSVDDAPASVWLADSARRSTRRSCLMNLLASLRTRPGAAAPLLDLVLHVFFVGNDRLYAKVDRRMFDELQRLALDPDKPFYAEGKPNAPIHGRLLSALPESPEVRIQFKELLSFRGEGKPSMQAVIATPPPTLPHTFAEFDLDLGNPLQDLVGFFVHMGELFDGKPTNHLDMHKHLGKTKASQFLYYKVVHV